MRVVIAIDSFKGSMTSLQAGNAAKEGVLAVYANAQVTVIPIADGGEGTATALIRATGATTRTVRVTGPRGAAVEATYGVSADGKTAYMEMAAAAGLTLLGDAERDPLVTTTYGVGEMMRDAIESGCTRLVMGIGGSATNDGGIGMLQALGFGLYDASGNPVPRGAIGLETLCRIEENGVPQAVRDCAITVACDVNNPLCGANGASAVFGPQKGASATMVRRLDAALSAFAALAETVYGHADADAPGAGAAGGLGFALQTFLDAEMTAGIDLVLRESGAQSAIAAADVVLTGEGRLDAQTAMGKAPVGVAAVAKRYGKPVIAFAGGVSADARACHEAGVDAYFPIVRGVCTLEEAMETTAAVSHMADTVEEVFRVIKTVKG